MATELERLKAWMGANGHDSKSLSRALGYHGDYARRIVTGKKSVGRSFRWLFARAFGDELAESIFDEPISADSTNYGPDAHPERIAASRAVQLVNGKKRVRPAHLCKCFICGEQAQHNHHPSYAPEYHFFVVPLCRSCHTKVHLGTIELDLGVPQPIAQP